MPTNPVDPTTTTTTTTNNNNNNNNNNMDEFSKKNNKTGFSQKNIEGFFNKVPIWSIFANCLAFFDSQKSWLLSTPYGLPSVDLLEMNKRDPEIMKKEKHSSRISFHLKTICNVKQYQYVYLFSNIHMCNV